MASRYSKQQSFALRDNLGPGSYNFEAGLVTVDWEKRELRIEGIGGHPSAQMSPEDVHARMQQSPAPGTEVLALVIWDLGRDGLQLCVHDASGYRDAVFDAELEEADDDSGE